MGKNQYHHKDLKNAIIDTSIEIIKASGIGELSIRNVAREIGVSHSALYRHYRNKEDLIVSIAIRGFHEMIKKMDQTIEKFSDDPLLQLVEVGKTHIQFAVSNSIYYRIMYGDIINNKTEYQDLFRVYDVGFRKLIEIIGRCPGGKKKKNTGLEITALAAWSLLHGYSCLVIDNKKDRKVGSDAQVNLIAKQLLMLVK